MNRRELLKTTTTSIVGWGILPSLPALLNSCGVSSERMTDYQPTFLSAEQFDALWLLSEMILPKTDSPGAADAGVAPFVDLLLANYYPTDKTNEQVVAINDFMQGVHDQFGQPFVSLDEEKRINHLEQLDEAEDIFFRSMKELTIWVFFTSETGRRSLNYLPVPGQV